MVWLSRVTGSATTDAERAAGTDLSVEQGELEFHCVPDRRNRCRAGEPAERNTYARGWCEGHVAFQGYFDEITFERTLEYLVNSSHSRPTATCCGNDAVPSRD